MNAEYFEIYGESRPINEFQLDFNKLNDSDFQEKLDRAPRIQNTLTDNKDNESDKFLDQKQFKGGNTIFTNKKKKNNDEKNKFKNMSMNINSTKSTNDKTSLFFIENHKACQTKFYNKKFPEKNLGRKRKNEPKNDDAHGSDEVFNGKIKAIRKAKQDYYDDCLGTSNKKITLKDDALKNEKSIIKLLKTPMIKIFSSSEFRNIKKENEYHYKEKLLGKIEKKNLDELFYVVLENYLNGPNFEKSFSIYKSKDRIKKNLMKLIEEVKKELEEEKE